MGGNRFTGGLAPLTNNPNDLALFLNITLPMIWGLYKTSHYRIARLICLSAMALGTLAIIFTFSRGGILTLFIMGAVWLRREARISGLSAVLIIGVIAVLMLAVTPAGYTDRVLSIIDPSKDETGSSAQRIDLMDQAFNDMISHPLGTGIGMNHLSGQKAESGRLMVHNVFLQVGMELGVAGLVAYLLLLWKSMKGLSRITDRTHPSNGAVVAFAGAVQLALLGYCVEALFHPVAYLFYVYYLVGMALAVKHLAGIGQENVRAETRLDGPGNCG